MSEELLAHLYQSNLTIAQENYLEHHDFVSLVISIEDNLNYLVYYGSSYAPLKDAPYVSTVGRHTPGADLARLVITRLERGIDPQGKYFYALTAEVPCSCGECGLSVDDDGDADRYYECDECRRDVPYCFGADDDYYELCNDCAVEKMNAKEAILDLGLGNFISVDPLWLALKIKHTDEYTALVNSLFVGGKVQAIARLQIASGMTDRAFVDALGEI
jgi:hypothetical protein